jgi:hypothetical protein
MFVDWWNEAIDMGHYENGVDFVRVAQERTKWRESPPIDDSAPEDAEWPEIPDRWPKIRDEAFHGLAGDVAKAISPFTEADPIAILLQFLAAFGNVIGRRSYFAAGRTWHCLNLFIALVGQTAVGRKGTSWSDAQRPFELVERNWTDNRVQAGLTSGEGLIYHVRDPLVVTKKIKDKTGETRKVADETDPGISDKRLMIIETEFARTAASHSDSD